MHRNVVEIRQPFGACAQVVHGCRQLVPWCWVKSRNERNALVASELCRGLWETAGDKSEEGGDDVKSSCPLCLGLQTCYIGRYRGLQPVRGSESQKVGPGSDWRLQLASMKAELLVIADQQRRGEYVPRALYTPPVTHRSRQYPKPVA